MKARVQKLNYRGGSDVAATNGLQETIRDDAVPAGVIVGGFLRFSVVVPDGETDRGTVEFYCMRLKLGEAIPVITEASLNALGDDLWQQLSLPLGGMSSAAEMLEFRTKRSFEQGQRFVMVAIYTLTGPMQVFRSFAGQVVWVSA